MFEHMDVAEPIYKSLVETSYKKVLGEMPTVMYILG